MEPELSTPDGTTQAKGSYCLVSLGCPKNLVDSERMGGLLRARGYELVSQAEGSDFVLINTCGFVSAAREESLSVIREMTRLKANGKVGRVIVAGCMAEREREALFDVCPGIDRVMGVFARDEIVQVFEEAPREDMSKHCGATTMGPAGNPMTEEADRLRLTPPHLAYLKISEGCDRRCSFCSIPSIRGPHVSKPIEQVVSEAEALVADGARELILVGQDATYYGIDTEGSPRLAELLTQLNEVQGVAWIRLMYLYPTHITDALVEAISDLPRVLPYLDLPLQHADDRILRRMNRRVTYRQTKTLLDRLRERIDGLALRTTMITGFPGETEEEFERLVQFVTEERFERLGAFAYSPEPGTPAMRMSGHLSESIRQSRRDRLLAAQQPIAFAWGEARVGSRMDVMIDRCIEGEKYAWMGRTHADAPEIDGTVYVTGEIPRAGEIVSCEVVEARGYDLIAVARP